MIYILLIVSLAMLVIGANWLVDGSAAIARRYHISEYIIGATIVGMGTSTPELVISSLSAFEGHSDIAVGNVVGSNIFNVFLILGITALIMPIKYTRENLQRDIPINIGVSVVTIALCALGIFWHGEYGLVRFDGLLMLVLFALYLWTTIRGNHKHQIEVASEEAATSDIAKSRSTTVYIAAIVFGLAGLIFGGDMFIDSASDIAREWGVSEAIIGLTIVAGGTSLPELVSSAIDAIRYYNGIPAGICSIFSCIDECEGFPVRSIYNKNDLIAYESHPARDCPLCKAGTKIDGLVNSHGISEF